jgi:hypothetical protein
MPTSYTRLRFDMIATFEFALAVAPRLNVPYQSGFWEVLV